MKASKEFKAAAERLASTMVDEPPAAKGQALLKELTSETSTPVNVSLPDRTTTLAETPIATMDFKKLSHLKKK